VRSAVDNALRGAGADSIDLAGLDDTTSAPRKENGD